MGSGAISGGPPTAEEGGSSWCPRCDDLAEAAAGVPCAACATPRVAVGPARRPEVAPGPTRRPAAELPWWLEAASGAGPVGPAHPDADRGVEDPAAGTGPAAVLAGPARPGRPDRGAPPVVGQRWLVGLLLVLLGTGAVAVRGAPLAPAAEGAGGARAAATRSIQVPPGQDPLSGVQVPPAPPSPPKRVLARPRTAVAGASGSLIVRYEGWLWRQRLAGGPAAVIGPVPDAPIGALSPDGGLLALVRSQRGRPMVEVRTVEGRVLSVANGTGPAWSLDGQLAYVRTPGSQRALTMSMSLSRGVPLPVLRVGGPSSWTSVPLPATLAEAQAGWTGDGNVPLVGRGGLFRVDVEASRVEPLAAGGGAASARGLPRVQDAGPLGGSLAGVPPDLVALAPGGRRVALVTRSGGRSRLEVAGSGRRTRVAMPADRFQSVHWSPAADRVWLVAARHLWAVGLATHRVVDAGPGLPAGASVLGLVP